MEYMQPLLLYTIGYPGAGKTSLARNLAGWFGGPHLRADEIGMRLFVMPTFSAQERQIVYQHMDQEAMAALNQKQVVLYDGTLNKPAERIRLEELAKQRGGQAVGLWVQVPYEVAKDRAGRLRDVGVGNVHGRVIPPEVFDRYASALQEPRSHEFVVQIDGRMSFGKQYYSLYRQLRAHGIVLPQFVEL